MKCSSTDQCSLSQEKTDGCQQRSCIQKPSTVLLTSAFWLFFSVSLFFVYSLLLLYWFTANKVEYLLAWSLQIKAWSRNWLLGQWSVPPFAIRSCTDWRTQRWCGTADWWFCTAIGKLRPVFVYSVSRSRKFDERRIDTTRLNRCLSTRAHGRRACLLRWCIVRSRMPSQQQQQQPITKC